MFDPGGSKGRLRACLFLGRWCALLCGKVSCGRWIAPEAGVVYFWQKDDLGISFSREMYKRCVCIEVDRCFPYEESLKLTARGYESCGGERMSGNAVEQGA